MLDNKTKLYFLRIFFGLFFLGIMFLGSFLFMDKEKSIVHESGMKMAVENPFDSLALVGKAAFVWDVRKNEPLYAKNGEVQLPLASLTKIMTAVVATESLPSETVVTIGKESLAQEGDSELALNERWTLRSLIDLTLLASSNDGAHALASAVLGGSGASVADDEDFFVKKMNEKARELRLGQTYFINESGLDVIERVAGGAYGSARDLALLFDYVLENHPELFEATKNVSESFTSQSGITHAVLNTNQLVSEIPGIIASKTGLTDLAGGNLAIIFEAGPVYPIVVVVLGSTQEERFSDVSQLVSATLRALYGKR